VNNSVKVLSVTLPVSDLATDARRGLLCLPALALLLAIGVATDYTAAALVAASGAFSVGFGSFQQFTRHKAAPMVLAALGMTLSAAVGSLLGRHEPELLLVTAVWSAAVGLAFVAFGNGPWWIATQWTIALVVAGAYPSGLEGAGARAALVLLGGGLQWAFIITSWRLGSPKEAAHDVRLRGYLRLGRLKLHLAGPRVYFALQTAAAATAALALARSLQLPNGYWAPMTALLVIRPSFNETLGRGLARFIGTLIGAGLATLAAALLRPNAEVTAVLVVVFAWSAYSLRRLHYAALTACITACIVFLLALAGLPEPANAWHRIVATLIGGAIAFCGALPGAPPAQRTPT